MPSAEAARRTPGRYPGPARLPVDRCHQPRAALHPGRRLRRGRAFPRGGEHPAKGLRAGRGAGAERPGGVIQDPAGAVSFRATLPRPQSQVLEPAGATLASQILFLSSSVRSVVHFSTPSYFSSSCAMSRRGNVRPHAFHRLASRSHSYGPSPFPETCPAWLGGPGCRRLAESAHPAGASQPAGASRPNIVYILADDLGYGDVQCLNPDAARSPRRTSTGWRRRG